MTKRLLRLTILIFALAVITLSSLGCELQDEIGKITDIFDNTETEVGRALVSGTSYLIIYDDGNFLVMNNISDDESIFDGITDGDKIEIVRNPEVAESYPAQCYVKKCKKLEDGNFSDLPQNAIDTLSELGWIKSN